MLGPREHDGNIVRLLRQQSCQQVRLCPAGDMIHPLPHPVGRLARRCRLDANRVVQKCLGQPGDFLRHGRRKQQRLALRRHHLGNPPQGMDETEIEHLVCLVENEKPGLIEKHRLAFDKIEQPARRRNENVASALQPPLLNADRLPADGQRNLQMGVANEHFQRFADLAGKLPGRRQDQRPNGFAFPRGVGRQQFLRQRQSEGCRLAGAGLRQAEHVAAFHDEGNGLSLDGRRLVIAHRRKGFQHRLRQAEPAERAGLPLFSGLAGLAGTANFYRVQLLDFPQEEDRSRSITGVGANCNPEAVRPFLQRFNPPYQAVI